MTKDPYYDRLLQNRYQLKELVGKGAMGQVYKAKDILLGGVTVAVKFLSQALLNEKMRQRFGREATICALLGEKSIHVVRVRDYGLDENEIPYYVMEYLQGKSLSDMIRRKPMPLGQFLAITRQIALGLQCAHEGIFIENEMCIIIHRDIKPSNILVVEDPTLGELAKILDFGIAKLLQSDGNQTQSFMGTLAYCSPEQMEGKELDNRSDLYSFGIMMFEMLTGELPLMPPTHSFGGWYKTHHFTPPKTFEEVNSELKIPKVLEALIMSCLEKNRDNRPQSASEIVKALEPLEQRFGKGRLLGQRISQVLAHIPIKQKSVNTNSDIHSTTSADEICRLATWPKSKPIAEIVFPRIIPTSREPLATLWVMLHKQEIQNRQASSIRYNQFLFLLSPHPMLLWITALYNRDEGVRWLPCYLDLKTPLGQEMAQLLSKSGYYRLLFFPLENPQGCSNVVVSTIAKAQCKNLQEWANTSQALVSVGQPQRSKQLLKQELEKLKPKILLKLQAIDTDSSYDVSG